MINAGNYSYEYTLRHFERWSSLYGRFDEYVLTSVFSNNVIVLSGPNDRILWFSGNMGSLRVLNYNSPEELSDEEYAIESGHVIEYLLFEQPMSRAMFAEAIGVSQASLSLNINGKLMPPHSVVRRMDKIFGRNPADLYNLF